MNKKEIYKKILEAEEYGFECIYISKLKEWFKE